MSPTMYFAKVLSLVLVLDVLSGGGQAKTLIYESKVRSQEDVHTDELQDLDFISRNRPIYFVSDGKTRMLSFINEFGELEGFNLDLIHEVCKIAKKQCKVILAEPTECVYTDRDNTTGIQFQDMDYGGSGLLGYKFDGCPNYELTIDREVQFDFTLPYLTTSSSFSVAPGNPSGFDAFNKDFSKFRIVHVTGESTNRECLKRLKKKFEVTNLVIAQDIDEAKAMILSGQADVLFSSRGRIAGMEVLPTTVNCGGDVGILLRKDSPIRDWWNKAFSHFYFSGGYEKLCKYTEKKYGHPTRCLPGPTGASAELLESLREVPDSPAKSDYLWTFVASGRSVAYSFLDEEGRLQGFTKDVIYEVCKRAGVRCLFTLTKNSECINTFGGNYYPGRGFQSGWWDSCTGYYNTAERRNSFAFTTAYLINSAHFQVAPGNPSGFNSSVEDFSKFVIVYQKDSETNNHCLYRLGKKFKKTLVVEGHEEAVKAVLSGKADVYFGTRLSLSDQLELTPREFHCDIMGTCMMLRKGSSIPDWWDPAFKKFYESGEYNKFCDEKKKLYNFDFPCLHPPKTMINTEKFDVKSWNTNK